jgi:hypothetical protein
VNRTWGDPAEQLAERHDAIDLDRAGVLPEDAR